MTSKSFIKPSIRVLVGDALDSIPKLDGIFDVVFIDADKSGYLDYLRLIEDNLHTGSVVIADNARTYYAEIFRLCKKLWQI